MACEAKSSVNLTNRNRSWWVYCHDSVQNLWRGLDFVSVWLLHDDSTNLITVLWDEVHLGETFVLKKYRKVVSRVVWSHICTYEVYIRVRHCTNELIIVRFHCSLFIPESLGTWERIWTVLRLFLSRSGFYSLLGTGLWTWSVGCWSTEREGGLVQQRGLDAVTLPGFEWKNCVRPPSFLTPGPDWLQQLTFSS